MTVFICIFLICFFGFQIQNFAATTQQDGVIKFDVSAFDWIFPTVPKQKNRYACKFTFCPSLSFHLCFCCSIFSFLQGLTAGCTQCYLWTHGMASTWWVWILTKYVFPFSFFFNLQLQCLFPIKLCSVFALLTCRFLSMSRGPCYRSGRTLLLYCSNQNTIRSSQMTL